MKPFAVIQARTGSTRLPGKVLASLGRRTVLGYVIGRCRRSRGVGGVAVATSGDSSDDRVADLARSLDVAVVRGSGTDVLSRYLQTADELHLELLVRITADCPLIDRDVIDHVYECYARSPADYVYVEGYPNGLGAAELVRVAALRRAAAETVAGDSHYREHVVTFLTVHPEMFTLDVATAPAEYHRPELRLSVDEPADLEVVRRVVGHFGERLDFTSAEVIAFLDAHPEVARLNRHVRQKTA